MSKHKHKHKKYGAHHKIHKETNKAELMNSGKITPKDQQDATANTGNETTNDEKPHWWPRLKEWVKKGKTFTDWCIAAFTFVLAVAAIYQFIIMGRQLDTMRKDQRPWIDLSFNPNGNALQVGSSITAVAHLVNGGKTPAKDISGDIVITLVKNGEEPRFDYPLPHSRFTTGALFPSRPMDPAVFSRVRTAADGVSVETDLLTQAEFDDFNQEKSFIVVYGMVSYKDFFGISHWTKICGFFPKPSGTKGVTAKKCADYGDIDGN